MKVIPKSATYFAEVKRGEVFKIDDGRIYMRIEDIPTPSSDYPYNTVHLESGNVYRVDDDTKVAIIDGAFVEGGGE